MNNPLTKKQSLWLSRIQAAQASGLGLAQYAEQHNLPLKQFYAWRATFKKLGIDDFSQAPAPAFVRIETTADAIRDATIRILLPNGVQLSVNELRLDHLRMLNSL